MFFTRLEMVQKDLISRIFSIQCSNLHLAGFIKSRITFKHFKNLPYKTKAIFPHSELRTKNSISHQAASQYSDSYLVTTAIQMENKRNLKGSEQFLLNNTISGKHTIKC